MNDIRSCDPLQTSQAQVVSSVPHQRSWWQHWHCWVVSPALSGARRGLLFLPSSSRHLPVSLLCPLLFSSRVLPCVSRTSRPNPLLVPVPYASGSWSRSAASHSTSATCIKSHANKAKILSIFIYPTDCI